MGNKMNCPRCGSDEVECRSKPTHMHHCLSCGYDGLTLVGPETRSLYETHRLSQERDHLLGLVRRACDELRRRDGAFDDDLLTEMVMAAYPHGMLMLALDDGPVPSEGFDRPDHPGQS